MWAEENSRASIFDALRRKETFGTSGTRLVVRVFGGWDLPAGLCADPNMVATGYAQGVPMGGMLPAPPGGGAAPTSWSPRCAIPGTTAHPGAPLQRLQVVKGWIVNGEPHQQVYDVAGDADNGASVDLATCTPHGGGADALCTVWTDPDFDPGTARLLLRARPREPDVPLEHLALQRPAAGAASRRVAAIRRYPKTIQERAWSSPIWYAGQ